MDIIISSLLFIGRCIAPGHPIFPASGETCSLPAGQGQGRER